MIKVVSLFSGIGGLDLGIESLGKFKTILMVENEPFCQRILAKRFPKTKIISDIREVDGKELRGKADVVMGGFPCQPFSVAGRQKGKEDNRYLWPEMLRIITNIKPRIVIGENVPGITNLQGGLETCVADLENQGYKVQCFNLPACGWKALHRRYRIFILAALVNTTSDGWSKGEPNKIERSIKQEGKEGRVF